MKTFLRHGVSAAAAALCCLPSSGSTILADWYNGHEYLLTDYGTWESCRAQAEAAGGYLVKIDDVAERNWLTGFAQDTYCRGHSEPMHNGAWIGLYHVDWPPGGGLPGDGQWPIGDGLNREKWRWASDVTTPSANVWNPHPSNSAQAGVHMYVTGANYQNPANVGTFGNNEWHDIYADYNFRGIVEIIPEPSAPLILSMAAVVLGLYRLRRRPR